MLFADVRGSTGIAEQSSPAQFGNLMQRFYGAATRVLLESDAVIDKFVGDEVVAFYVPALAGPEHARAGVRAALALLRATGHADPGGPWVPVGIGLHTGVALVGSIGAEGVTDVTALGDAVNTAARLASLAGRGEVLVSETTCISAGLEVGGPEHRLLDVRGRSEPVAVRVLHADTNETGAA
jgi:adenylate cyclase